MGGICVVTLPHPNDAYRVFASSLQPGQYLSIGDSVRQVSEVGSASAIGIDGHTKVGFTDETFVILPDYLLLSVAV